MEISELQFDTVRAMIGERKPDAHKGDNGKALLLAGSAGLSGAALLCSAAALRAGIGTLRVFTQNCVAPEFMRLPEVMCTGFDGAWDDCPEGRLASLIDGATVLGAGPGLGSGEGVLRAVYAALKSGLPMVLDADGLNALSRDKGAKGLLHRNVVITPHVGEMARLTGLSIDEIKSDMQRVALEFAKTHDCTVVLKSDRSVIASYDGRVARNTTGNSGLAKGGSGDVLTGITLALLGQGLSPFDAGCAASFILGQSADRALSLLRERALIARDVIDAVGYCIFDWHDKS